MKIGQTKLNAIANYANFIVLGALNFALSPLLASSLGPASFGLWKASLRYLEFATTADGRSTQALKWLVAYRAAQLDDDSKRREVGASMALWLAWLPLLLAALAFIVFIAPHAIKGVPPSEFSTLRWTCAILGLNVVIAGLIGVPDAVLTGTNQGFRSMNINTMFLIVSNVAMLAAAMMGGNLILLATITVLCSALNGFFTLLSARRRVSWWGVKKPTLADVKGISQFSGWTMGWSLVQMLLMSTEIILVGYLLGALEVAKYTFTSYVVQFALSMCLLTASAIAPKIGLLLGEGQRADAASLVRQTREIILSIATITAAAILLFNKSFVTLWAGAQSYLGDPVNGLMVATFFQLALARCEAQIQDVGLNIRQKVLTGALSAALGIFLGWLGFVIFHNLAFVFAGILLGRMLMTALFPRFVDRMFDKAAFPFGRVLVAALLLILCYFVGLRIEVRQWLLLALSGATAAPLLILVTFWAILSSSTRNRIVSYFNRRA